VKSGRVVLQDQGKRRYLYRAVDLEGNIQYGRMTSQAIYNVLRKRTAEANVTDFSPHDVRRTFAGDMLDRGVDIVTVQKQMGDASVNTTGRYNRRP
jgi:site-specific recombinase XerD